MKKHIEQSTIIRTNKRENPYVMIDKFGLNDERLSWKAKGLLAYLLSKPDNWQIYERELIKRSKDGRDSVRAGLRELEKFGYISRRQLRNEDGSFSSMEYIVYERPIEITRIEDANEKSFDNNEPQTENPSTDFPSTENPLLLNNDLNNNDLNNLIDCMETSVETATAVELPLTDLNPIIETLQENAGYMMIDPDRSLKREPQYIAGIYVMLINQFRNQLDPAIVEMACDLFSQRTYDWTNCRMKLNVENPVGLFNVCYKDAIKEYKTKKRW
jgi:hypothetical protein